MFSDKIEKHTDSNLKILIHVEGEPKLRYNLLLWNVILRFCNINTNEEEWNSLSFLIQLVG